MAESVVSLCNKALLAIGAATISDLKEGSKESLVAGQFYALALDTVLSGHAWPFASKRQRLALKTANLSTMRFCYGLPFDCLLARELVKPFPDMKPIPFETGNQGDERVLYTDLPGAVLLYTARIVDPALFSPGFCAALSAKLAAMFAIPITQNANLAQMNERAFQTALAEAETEASQESEKKPRREAEWMRARR